MRDKVLVNSIDWIGERDDLYSTLNVSLAIPRDDTRQELDALKRRNKELTVLLGAVVEKVGGRVPLPDRALIYDYAINQERTLNYHGEGITVLRATRVGGGRND